MPTTLITAIFLIVAIIAYVLIWTAVNKAKPITSTKAQVTFIDKRDSGDLVRRGGLFHINFSKVYHVTFTLLPDGKKKRLTVPVAESARITVGAIGILTRQGSRFISFKRSRK